MKLADISEGYLSQKLQEKFTSSNYFDRPLYRTDQLYNPSSGFTSDSRTSGDVNYKTGVPKTIRQQQYMGLVRRPYSLRFK
jgi:hypothetical protein